MRKQSGAGSLYFVILRYAPLTDQKRVYTKGKNERSFT